MSFIKDIAKIFVKSYWASFFIIADTTRDLLIMHACDTFCDELILLHMLFQSAVIALLLISQFS